MPFTAERHRLTQPSATSIQGKTAILPRAVIVLLLSCCTHSSLQADQPVSETKLYRSLTGRREPVRSRTVTAYRRESAHLRSSLDIMIAAARQNIKEAETEGNLRSSTSELLYLLGTVDKPEVEDLLVDSLDSPLTGIAILSVDILGKYRFHGAIDFLKKQTQRDEYRDLYGFRFSLLRAFARMQHPDAIDFLTAIQPSLDGQLRHQVDEALNSVTVNHFLGDETRFAKWQTRKTQPPEGPEADGNIFKASGDESESLNRINLQNQQYYGINIHAKRLMFIIDHSGSMEDYWGGMSRLARAKVELIKAIRELPEDSEFAIMFYESTVRIWRDELVYASEDNKLKAIDFIRRLGYGDRTNTYGALRKSLDFDDELEAVFLLTDGRPTIGELVDPAKIIHDILGRNRFRHLNFNTIGIAVTATTESFLKRLAEESSGEYRRAL